MVRAPVKPFFLLSFLLVFAFAQMLGIFKIYMFAEKACFDLLCTCKATSLKKIAELVWRYSNDAAIIENMYKFCMEENKSVTESCMG